MRHARAIRTRAVRPNGRRNAKSSTSLVELTARRRRAVAYHEAAHAVALWCLFGPGAVGDIWVARFRTNGEPEGMVVARTPPPRSFHESVNHLAVCAAGWVGERSVNPDALYWGWGLAPDGQSCDGTELGEIGRRICLSADEAQALGNWATARAEAIVVANRAAVRAVADALVRRGHLSARELRELLLSAGAQLQRPW